MGGEHTDRGPQSVTDRVAFDALVAEFQYLRTEIQWLIANGMRYQQFAILIAAAGLSASTFTMSQYPHLHPALGFALSAVLSWLGILYYWEHVEIHVVAGYLQQVVREKVRAVTRVDTWWEWEEYKGAQWRTLGTPNLFRWRLSSFCFIALLFAVTSLAAAWQYRDDLRDDRLVAVTSASLFFGSLGLTVRLLFLIIFRSRLSERFLDRRSA